MTGTIARKVEDRGFGFIKGDDGKDYFFHRSGCITSYDQLGRNQPVQFEVEKSDKGPRATEVEAV